MAAYLYLGVRMLLDRRRQQVAELPVSARGSTAQKTHAVLNEGRHLFLAPPQFVDSSSSSVLAFLSSAAMFTGTLWCLTLVWCASMMGRRFRNKPSAGVLVKRAAGACSSARGVKMAAARQRLLIRDVQ